MAGQSLLDMLLGRGKAVGALANVAANGFPEQQAARQPVPAQAPNENYNLEDLMGKLTQARERQKAVMAAEALRNQNGQVLPPIR